MKELKNKILIIIAMGFFIVTGCGTYNTKSITKDLDNKLGKLKSYRLSGELEIVNNDDLYNYDVDVSYKAKDKYKIVLTNKNNKHEQIILKNDDGVYVLTPALNKSFKFQSDWPYNTSQAYLLEAILRDIKNDSKKTLNKKDKGYILTTKVNYTNNNSLVNQKIILDNKLNLKKIEVFNKKDIPIIQMKFKKIDYNPTFKNSYFDLPTSVNENKNTKTTSKIEDTVYPLFVPDNTKLASEEKIKKNNGERIIMSFEGEKPFLLVEETASREDEFTVIPTYGEPYMLTDTIGVMADNAITWTSNNMEYYIVSNVISNEELLEIARSINVIPTMK